MNCPTGEVIVSSRVSIYSGSMTEISKSVSRHEAKADAQAIFTHLFADQEHRANIF
jgi:hypothetical protein